MTVHPIAETRNLEVMLVFFFSLQFQMLPKYISDASVFLYFPKAEPLFPLTRTTVALTGLLTPTLFFFTCKHFFSRFLAALGCYTQTLAVASRGFSVAAVRELCVAVAARASQQGPGRGAAGVVARGLRGCGSRDQGSNLCPPYRQPPKPWASREARLYLLLQPHSFSTRQPRQPGSAAALLDGLR